MEAKEIIMGQSLMLHQVTDVKFCKRKRQEDGKGCEVFDILVMQESSGIKHEFRIDIFGKHSDSDMNVEVFKDE